MSMRTELEFLATEKKLLKVQYNDILHTSNRQESANDTFNLYKDLIQLEYDCSYVFSHLPKNEATCYARLECLEYCKWLKESVFLLMKHLNVSIKKSRMLIYEELAIRQCSK